MLFGYFLYVVLGRYIVYVTRYRTCYRNVVSCRRRCCFGFLSSDGNCELGKDFELHWIQIIFGWFFGFRSLRSTCSLSKSILHHLDILTLGVVISKTLLKNHLWQTVFLDTPESERVTPRLLHNSDTLYWFVLCSTQFWTYCCYLSLSS